MSVPVIEPATCEDLCALPPDRVGEIVYDVLHSHPRPAPKHTRSASTLGGALFPSYDKGRGGPGGRWILPEPELHLGPHVLLATCADQEAVRAVPFDAVPLEPGLLWA